MSWKDFRVPDEYLGVARYAEEGSKYIISTPYKIACEMVELLPEELFVPETKFLNIFSKSGQILLAIKERLMESEAMIKRFPNKRHRRNHIVWHQLYGLCMTERCIDSTAIMLYDTAWNNYNNIVKCENLISLVKEDKNKALEFIHKNFKEYNEFLNESEDTGEIMKFDVVIGNPPYNNDMYIPFVEMGHRLATKYSVFITPAKWQAKGGKLNESFRKNIVPYMSKIVYYKDSTEVFDIEEWGGISYYIINKELHPNKLIKSICNKNGVLDSDFEEHTEDIPILYSNIIVDIIKKCSIHKYNYHVTQCEYTEQSEYGNKTGEIAIVQSGKITGYLDRNKLKTTTDLDKWKVSITRMIGAIGLLDGNGKTLGSAAVHKIKPMCVPKGSFPGLMKFNSELEADSFISFIYSKLASFMMYLGICGSSISDEFFRYMPTPEKFDHIFTDEELYKKYNLTQDEINIIESVIKERK